MAITAVSAAVVIASSPMAAVAERLAPGEPILLAAESAAAVVAGVVASAERLDSRTYAALLRVERALAGEPAEPQKVVWQQSSRSAPRFAIGDRVLVALQALPDNSFWQRHEAAEGAMLVAAEGFAYVADPRAAALDAMAAYLALDAGERRQPPGLERLAQLVEVGQPVLAAAALRRMRDAPSLPDLPAVELLAAVAADRQRPRSLRVAIVQYFAQRRVAAARPHLAALAAGDADLQAEAMDALATLEGGIDEETAARLLRHPEAAQRAVGARHAPQSVAQRMLPEVARRDAEASVRAAAVATLAGTGTVWGLAAAVDGLADPAAEVRSAAAFAIARLGEPALPALLSEIRAASAAAPGAIATLSLMGAAGRAPLEEVARSHPDEQLRGLATLALGEVRDHHD